jgi:hypothetical protein
VAEKEDALTSAFQRFAKDSITEVGLVVRLLFTRLRGILLQNGVGDGLRGLEIARSFNTEYVSSIEETGELPMAVRQEATGPNYASLRERRRCPLRA